MADLSFFAIRYPRLYHLTFAENVEAIRRGDLLSFAAIARQAGIASDEPRPEIARIDGIKVRDQKPLDVKGLARVAPTIAPRDYVRSVDARVFFWVRESDRDRLLKARAYRGVEQKLLIFDTGAVLRDWVARVELSRLNSGTIFPLDKARRDLSPIYVPFADWTRPVREVRELTVLDRLPGAARYLVEVISPSA